MDDLDLFGAFDGKETVAVDASTFKEQPQGTKRKKEDKDETLSGKCRGKKKAQEKPEGGVSSPPDENGETPNAARHASDEVKDVVIKTVGQTERETEGPVVSTGTTEKNVVDFTAVPEGYEAPSVPSVEDEAPKKPAKEYPFKLDPFQQNAVNYIERGESVLVSAHTSAGKTAVAEYAIAKSLRDKQRVVYTSPIKALSNQKYRDLAEEFEDVGLMTGDVTINPNAACLIMTTEILRSMLYRGSELMREVAWVIYDEIHYMRDKERGVVWEESIILLPPKVRFVFLSATIPNARQFASWIAKIKLQPCHVVYTDYRPTPLEHYVFPAGGEGLYLVVDKKGRFREDSFQKAMAALAASAGDDEAALVAAEEGGKKRRKRRKKNGGGSDLSRIVQMIMERGYDPVIVFSFSKRECEAYAMQMSRFELIDEDARRMVEQVFTNAIDSLSEDDKRLPQVEGILPLLKKGVGIHHGGLLPILKEVVEILFAEGLLKILFATETFAMGINMPARTVVFTQCRKFDGKDFRWITAGEYIQMSGRAGRRGLDSKGIVIQMVDEKMEPAAAKSILYGQADPLHSSFYLGYNMLLNLLRVEDADPEYMIMQSFHQFQNEQTAPGIEEELQRLEREQEGIQIKQEETVAEYYHISRQLSSTDEEVRQFTVRPDFALPFLNAGRLIQIVDGARGLVEGGGEAGGGGQGGPAAAAAGGRWDWGVVVGFSKKVPPSTALHGAGGGGGLASGAGAEGVGADSAEAAQYVVDVLIECAAAPSSSSSSSGGASAPVPPGPGEEGEMRVVPVLLQAVRRMSSLRIYIPKDLRPRESRQAVAKSLREVKRRFTKAEKLSIPLLDPLEDMQIEDSAFQGLLERLADLQKRLESHSFHSAADRDQRFALYARKVELSTQIRFLRKELKQTRSMVLKDNLKRMKRVLRRLGHLDAGNVVQLKGRVACEVSTADEVLLTELIFNGVFNELPTPLCVALLSCLVHQGKAADGSRVREELSGPLRQLKDAAREVGRVMQEAKVPVELDEYVDSFTPDIMEPVLAWCRGAKFAELCKLTDIFEGTIIRCIRRLEEVLKQLQFAAHAIGNLELEKKFAEGSTLIKRDIVFAASLYL